ncbi:hypothetical protein [Pigmentiphaga litoralis]|uniref:hypothetical protein n=1 Tax=Pigmentiphaga litoralis TaxID=516702 RepID=UPI003B4382EB
MTIYVTLSCRLLKSNLHERVEAMRLRSAVCDMALKKNLAVRLQTEINACYIHWLDGTNAKRNAICLGSSGAAGSEEQWCDMKSAV